MRAEDKNDLYNTVFTELKKLGVKVPKVKKFKTIISKQQKGLPQSKSKIFGVCLCDQEWTADHDFILPKFIASSIAYLRDYIAVEGLFRKAGSIARQRDLRVKLENGENLDGSEPNDVASLLKQWLRELPEPLIPIYMHDIYIRCQQLETSESRITANLLSCLLLPPDHLRTLKYLLLFLSDFAEHSEKNKMGSHNLALIMAPNIFVMGADSTDKSSPDLVELHISILQLLIKNAVKVGGIPASVSFQHPALDSCSELDSSGDILDSSPYKSRKKRRSGPVQDIFNGIKKLVGQTATPTPRSASKRKAENNDGSLPKKLTVEVNGERTSCETPKNKANHKLLNTDGKMGSGRTRKKSFGLLRRKRQKSTQESPQSKVSPSLKSPFNWDVDVKVNNSLQLPDLPSPVSPFNLFDSNKALKSDSIKKSTSDCYLMVPSAKISALFSSASQGQLKNPSIASPYNLRTKFEGSQKSQMQSLESIQLEMKKIMDDAEGESKSSHHQEINTRSPVFAKSPLTSSELILEIGKEEGVMDTTKKPASVGPKIQDSTDGVSKIASREGPSRKSSSRKKGNGSQSRVSENTMSRNEFYESLDAKSLLSETLLQLDAKLSKKGNCKATHQNRNTKQEAGNLKLQQKLKNPLDPPKSHEASNMKKKSHENQSLKKDMKNHQLRKCQSVNLGDKCDSNQKNMSGRKVAEKTTRKASLIRGRPNTVKSGLPSDLCQRFNNDSPNSNFVENPSLITSNISKSKEEFSLHNHEVQFKESSSIPNQNEKETYYSDEKVSPLNLKFQFFTLSSPPTTSPINNLIPDLKSNQSATFSIFDDSSFTKQDSKSHLKKPLDVSQKRKLSIPVFEEKTSFSPGNKIPRLRKSLDTASRKSSLNKASTDLKRKSGSSLCNGNTTKIPARSADSLKDLSTLDISMNDSCFKTPNKIASPDSVTWMSGKKYLDINFPHKEEAFNKRESIAMILKNKSGHVQSKVHLWDTKVRESVYCTRSVPTYSTPTAAFIANETSSQKQRSNSQRNRKPLSVSKSCNSASSSKNRIRPPLPPPPKFDESELNTTSPNVIRPLKEVTNISFGMNESKNSMNGSLSKDEFGLLDISLENLVPKQNRRKGNRNSFSNGTPQKCQKRVSRSESSPCHRPIRRSPRLVQESTVGSHLTVLEDDFVPTRRLLRSSTSKSGSCLSIEN